MRRLARPAPADPRQPWQIEQGRACGCRGTDDMCPCQNVERGKGPHPDYEAWLRFEAAIGHRARALCSLTCTDAKGEEGCRLCGAHRDVDWRRDAINELRK